MQIDLHKGDCLELMKDIPDGSVDLVLTDPPYGTMKGAQLDGWKNQTTEWDNAISPVDIFGGVSRVLRPNGKCVLFSQEPYTSKLITESIPSLPFSYRAIWYKNVHANPLVAKSAMVGRYEDICVFVCSDGRGGAADYMRDELQKSGMRLLEVNAIVGTSTMAGHYFHTGSQFALPTQQKYELLQKTGFWQMPYKQLADMAVPTFNLWQGGKSKSNVLEYAKDNDGYHPTQKPVALLEDLIQTYSNNGDTVLDFTMGSGSTGVACINTHRRFIGIELDETYFNIAKERIYATARVTESN
ncbi:MAG TPA: site-specific DNA-methyltransferase [Clostridia bacterium]|nr:site-specific DNA-methyltransferase [Clostridia bacterium]